MTTPQIDVQADFPEKLAGLFQPSRYKVLHGGRGGGKSWAIARYLLLLGQQSEHRILCVREFMQSLQDSVWRLLCDQIFELGLTHHYEVNKGFIRGRNGTEFRFAGIRSNVQQIKSFEGVTLCWCEEASNISKYSWDTLIPTIRRPGSEIIISMNPELETDDSYRRWILNPPSDAWVQQVGWRDNPWLPEVLRKEMLACKERDFNDYLHIWEGQPRRFTEGAIYLHELQQAEEEGRIMRVPYEPRAQVQAFFDLGYADATAIWLAQRVGYEVHCIDYIEASRKPLDYFLKTLANKPYPVDVAHLPHDGRARQLGTGRSVEEMIRGHGYKTLIVPNLSVADGIAAARSIFPTVYFDKVKCDAGINALRHYRFEMESDQKGGFKPMPRHDFSSHGADSFRYLALALRAPKSRPDSSKYREAMRVHAGGSDSWMSM